MIRKIGLAKLAFITSVCLSLVMCAFLFLNLKSLPQQTESMKVGRDVLNCVSALQGYEQAYMLHRKDRTLEDVREAIEKLRKPSAQYEGLSSLGNRKGFWGADIFETMDIYERLFDQLLMYHKAAEKKLSEVQELEEELLAIIYSKMNPERGIIALQEIRIAEKEYLLMQNRLENPEDSHFQKKRKTSVANLLMWAQKDKRIEELMEKDTELFNQTIKNLHNENNTLLALQKEREKIQTLTKRFMDKEKRSLNIASRRSRFLCLMLAIMWLVTGLAVVVGRFGEKA